MYGVINKAIEEFVNENYGEQSWLRIKAASGIDIDFFVSNEPYDDSVTYDLAVACAEELKLTVPDVLFAFGEYWVLNTSMRKYAAMMESGGKDLFDFISNLPSFHNRVSLIYPNLTPPEFNVTDAGEGKLKLHYYSKREGLESFVRGLLHGLSKMFNEPISVELMRSRSAGGDHDEFVITWIK